MHKRKQYNTPGFTIVELLIVIIVIAILAAITIVSYNGISDRTRRTALQIEASQIAHSLATSNAADDVYPTNLPQSSSSSSNNHTVDYNLAPDRTKYCVSVSDGIYSYRVSSANTAPVEGTCWIVSTLVGSGTAGNANGTGSAAQFNYPFGITADASGTVYVGDYANHRIRKITSSGVVTTLAGSTAGYTDATGVAAQFNHPTGVAVDAAGTVYVADNDSNLIRKITPAGVVTTLAGGTAGGFADGNSTAARFSVPTGVAVDVSGNVYVADRGNHRVRKITPSGSTTTLAGSSTAGSADGTGSAAQFITPTDVAVDASGNVYVSDSDGNMSPVTTVTQVRIRKITPAGVVTTITSLSSPKNIFGITLDGAGNVYAVGMDTHTIQKITPTGLVTRFAGTGTAGATDGLSSVAQFNTPIHAIYAASGDIYVTDYNGNKIRKMTVQY